MFGLKTKQDLLVTLHEFGEAIHKIPYHLIDKDHVMAALPTYPRAIQFIHSSHIDRDLAVAALDAGITLQGIPYKVLDADLCFTAVKNDTKNAFYVPIEYFSRDICIYLAETDNINLIPSHLRDKEICMIALTTNHNEWRAQCIPANVIDKELAEIIIRTQQAGVTHIPLEVIDEDLCVLAAEYDLLKHIPIKTRRVCIAALKADEENFQHIPLSILNEDDGSFYNEVVDADFFTHIPPNMITKKIALKALRSIVEFCHIPKSLIDEEICMAALKAGVKIHHLPFQTEALCFAAVQINEENLRGVISPTKEICLTAVKKNGLMLAFVPKEFMDEEMCDIALKDNPLAIQYIESPTEEMYRYALDKTPFTIQYINSPSKEMCLETIKRDGRALLCIEDQTPEICLEAIKMSYKNLLYVRNQTDELCIAALALSSEAGDCIRDKDQKRILTSLIHTGTPTSCCVCWEASHSMTRCGHSLCLGCFRQLIQSSCPLCRQTVSEA